VFRFHWDRQIVVFVTLPFIYTSIFLYISLCRSLSLSARAVSSSRDQLVVMRALGRVQDRLRPAPSHPVSADDVDGGLPDSAAVDSDHTSGLDGLQCPTAVGRCARHLARRLRGDRSDTTGGAGHQPSGTSGDDVTDECWCCRLAYCMCGGLRRLVTTLTDKHSTESKCQSPGCKWWKSGCTRIYLISVNLASFVRTDLIASISNYYKLFHSVLSVSGAVSVVQDYYAAVMTWAYE
jgi:hypothetical protein